MSLVDAIEFDLVSDTARKIANDELARVLGNKQYAAGQTSIWTEQITQGIIEKLREIAPLFKYVVSLTIIQQKGCGLHSDTVAHWDMKTDGIVQVKYENNNLIAICTVLGVGI